MPSPVLRATGVGKRFGANVALDHVDLSIDSGEVVALMGANGAGKSTLVKILSGVYRAGSGTLTLAGAAYEPASPHDALRRGVATVHQSIADAVVPTLSVADNLLLDEFCTGTSAWFRTARQRRVAAAQRAARVGLGVDVAVDLNAPLASLPLAAQQRVTIARALATHPALLILDEPTASLSAPEAERLFELIDRLRGEGVATLLVSHRQGDLRRIADRIVVLRDGRVVDEQRQPVDFDAALEAMLGRRLHGVHRQAYSGSVTESPADALEHALTHAQSPVLTHPDPGPALLSIRNLRLRSDSAPFDLDVRRGEIVAITGPIGSGKSRFARTLFGVARAVSGTVTLDGTRWQPRTPADAIRAGVFMLGEDRRRTSLFPDQVPGATIAGTIGFPFLARWFRGGFVRHARERLTALASIERFGIRCSGPQDLPGRLSGGNQQKVVLARWHAEPARLLLLDEPFQGVDAGARADIIALLRSHAHTRATLVFVSDLDEALEVADRIIAFEHGAPDVTASPRFGGAASASATASATAPVSLPVAASNPVHAP